MVGEDEWQGKVDENNVCFPSVGGRGHDDLDLV